MSLCSNEIFALLQQVMSCREGIELDISFHVQDSNPEVLICRSLTQHIAPLGIAAECCLAIQGARTF